MEKKESSRVKARAPADSQTGVPCREQNLDLTNGLTFLLEQRVFAIPFHQFSSWVMHVFVMYFFSKMKDSVAFSCLYSTIAHVLAGVQSYSSVSQSLAQEGAMWIFIEEGCLSPRL